MINAYAATEPGGTLEPWEYDPGPLGTTEVEIEVEHCGICHSDISMLNNEWGMSTYPIVPGHEVVGKIGAIGSDVSHLEVGQKVGLGWHSAYCMTCHNCMSGDHNLCRTATATIGGHHGGFADKVRAAAASTIPLPEQLDISKAGPLFCGGITVYNPLKQYNVQPTDRVGVIGIGGLGHLALQFCNAWGCEVTAFTTSDSKRDEALQMGAHDTINSRDPIALKQAAGRFIDRKREPGLASVSRYARHAGAPAFPRCHTRANRNICDAAHELAVVYFIIAGGKSGHYCGNAGLRGAP